MLHSDRTQDRPQSGREIDSWDEVVVEPLPISDPNLDALLDSFRLVRRPYGGAELACFRLVENPVLDWYASRRRLHLTNFFEHFLVRPVVGKALPSLNITYPFRKVPEVRLETPFSLDGVLASSLYYGGAYGHFAGTPREAKVLAGAFCASLWEERLDEIDLYVTYTAWTGWFGGLIWDGTPKRITGSSPRETR